MRTYSVRVRGNPLRTADRGEEAGAHAGRVAVARQRHDGHAHPERLAGRGRAVIGEGIERDVHPAVAGQVLGDLGRHGSSSIRSTGSPAAASRWRQRSGSMPELLISSREHGTASRTAARGRAWPGSPSRSGVERAEREDMTLLPPHVFGLQGILYLTDTEANQGAFSCIPGFHRKLENWLQALPPNVDPRQAILNEPGVAPVAGKAGDLVIWHHALPHGSSPNFNTLPRVAQYIFHRPTRWPYTPEWK